MFGILFTFCEKYSTQQKLVPGLFLGVKQPERGTDHSPFSSAEVVYEESYISA